MIEKLRLRSPAETASGIAMAMDWRSLNYVAPTVPHVAETLLIVATLDSVVVEWVTTPSVDRWFPPPESATWGVAWHLGEAEGSLARLPHGPKMDRWVAEVEGRLQRLAAVGLVSHIDASYWRGFRQPTDWTLGEAALKRLGPAKVPAGSGSRTKRTPRKAISQGTRFDVLERCGFRCFYCARKGSEAGELEIDHVMPVTKGGSSHVSNLVAACRDCNQGKRAKIIDLVGELQ